MKKQKILILSLAAVAGMVLTGCSLTPGGLTNDEAPDTSVIEDEIETADEVGTKVTLRNAVTPTAQVNMSNAFGYQILDKTSSTMSVRIIAVVDDYKNLTAASVTSKVVSPRSEKATAGEDEEVIKAEKTFNVTEVYSSLTDADSISWSDNVESSFAKKYYIIYTLRNVPVAHYFDTIIVKFSATSMAEGSKEFIVNAQGVEGENKYVNFEKVSGSETEYAIVGMNYSSITGSPTVYVSGDHYTVTDLYAVKDGIVTTINYRGFWNSSSKNTIGELVLPNTITTLKNGAFYSAYITKLNIPSSVTTVEGGAFYGYNTIDTLTYEATNLSNDNAADFRAKNVIVKSTVTAIPNKFFSTSKLPESVKFEGTEDAWDAMKTESNKGSGFYAVDAVCSDTTYSTVTFHYGEGKFGNTTGDVEVTARNRRALENPGSPVLSGKEFKGWYTDSEGTTAFDFNSLITSDLDLYAVYGEPGAGYSFANPLVIDPSSASNFTAELYPGKEFEYIKFTVPETATQADWYYFSVDEDSSKKDSTASTCTSSIDGDIVVYGASDTENALSTDSAWTIKSDKVAQYSASDKGIVRIYAAPGETYYLKAAITRSYYSNQGQYNYGTIAMKFYTYENDSVSEAIAMSKGTAVAPNFVDRSQKVLCKYTAETSETVIFKKDDKGSNYTNITVVDAADPTTQVASASGTGSANFGFDTEAGHTYYIEVAVNTITADVAADKYFSLSITDTPKGYSKGKALSYTLGETKTVTQIYTSSDKYMAGTYYSFNVSEGGLYGVTTTVGSSSYGQTAIIYDANGDVVTGGTLKSSSKGKALDASEVTLTAGTYTVFVGYDGSISGGYDDYDDYGWGSSSSSKTTISSWKDFTFSISKIAAGDSINLPEEITPTLDADTTLAGSTKGKFYKVTATADNYLIIDVSNVSSGSTVALLSTSGTSLKTASNGKIVYQTTSGTSYIVKVSGKDASETVKFSRADTVETGESGALAYSLNLDSDGLADLTSYAPSSSSSMIYFKYTASKTGTFKLFFQALKDGSGVSGNGPDSNIGGVYTSPDATSSSSVSISNYKDDDKGAHPETLGTNYSSYGECAFTSGTTYYFRLKVPALGSTADTLKFGIREKTVGSAADVPDTGATIDSSTTSISVDGTSDGYWSTVSFSVTKKFTFTLPDENTTIKIYSPTDTTTPIATLSGTAASDDYIIASGDYLFYCQIAGASAKTSVSVSLAQADLPDYVMSNLGGTESAPTADSKYVWSYDEATDMWTSGNKGASSSCSKLSYTFYSAGTLTFKYYASGENNFDYLNVLHNTTTVVSKAGGDHASVTDFSTVTDADFTEVTITVASGDTVDIIFRKDGSGNNGLDSAYIKNLVFTKAA